VVVFLNKISFSNIPQVARLGIVIPSNSKLNRQNGPLKILYRKWPYIDFVSDRCKSYRKFIYIGFSFFFKMFLFLENLWRKRFEEKNVKQICSIQNLKKCFSHQIIFFLKIFFLHRKCCKKIVKMFFLRIFPIQILYRKSALILGFSFFISDL
jgi:hypothetical protein